jgi:aminocarboxymuconate-semialdehyde decarboxylase
MATTIDIHAHLTPHNLLAAKRDGRTLHGIDPETIARGQGLDIDVGRRLADMDRLGVDIQVVSAEPQMYCYQHPVERARSIHQEANDEVHQLQIDRPDRFRGLAIVPLQDTRAAIAEMERAVGGLGMSGVMIGDHVNGQMLDEPSLAPFWAAAEALGAVVFLHQASPTLVSTRIKRYHLPNTVGNPVERTLSFAALVFGGVMDRHPNLTVVLGHGGGYTCFAAGRMDWGWQWRAEARANIARPPSAYLPRFYYDSITHSESALRFIIDTVGIDRVVFGTDYPGYAAGKAGADYQPRDWLAGLVSLSEPEKSAVLGGNLERLFGIGTVANPTE